MDYVSKTWVSLALGLVIGSISAIGYHTYGVVLAVLAVLFWVKYTHCSRIQCCAVTAVALIAFVSIPDSTRSHNRLTSRATGMARIVGIHYGEAKTIITMKKSGLEGGILYGTTDKSDSYFVNQWVRMSGRMTKPASTASPGGFDALAWARTYGAIWQFRGEIHAIVNHRKDRSWHSRLVLFSRKKMDQGRHWYGRQVLKGLLLGDRRAIPEDALDAFQDTGTAHLLAVSGLHLGACSFAVWTLFCFLGQRLRMTYPHRLAGFASMVVTVLFLVIAQSPMSAKRAAVMICYGILGAMIGRPVPASRLVALAILIVLIPNPYLIKHPGFQFSFGAVIALVTLCRNFKGINAFIAVSFVASIATWPIQVWHFGTLCPWAPITNLVLTPLASLLVVPLGLLGLVLSPISQLPLDYAAALAEYFVSLTQTLAELTTGTMVVGRWPSPLFLILPVLLLTMGYPYIQLLSVVGLVYTGSVTVPPDHYVDFIPVGQGDSILLVSKKSAALIDAGPSSNASTIVGHLHRMGLSKLEWIAITHHHPDHFAGLPYLVRHLQVEQIKHLATNEVPDTWTQMVDQSPVLETLVAPIRSGDLGVGSLHVRAFRPTESRWVDENDRSIAFRVDGMTRSVLITGDLESFGELRLSHQGVGQIDILNLGHHGSRTSTGSAFLDALQPSLAVASCGAHNRYGFPHAKTLAELKERKIPILTTARDGLIRIHMGIGAQSVETYRSSIDSLGSGFDGHLRRISK